VFTASPPQLLGARQALAREGSAVRPDLPLVRAECRVFTGPAQFLSDPANRGRTAEYLTDMVGAYGRQVSADLFGERQSAELGQSYGEMAQELIGSVVSADEPVELLILAFSVHDLWPSRQTAAYLSGVTPGAPMAFAVCDQGSAAAFSGLRIAREYAASAGVRRSLLIVVEQAKIPYECPIPLPLRHQGVAMLYGDRAQPSAPEIAERPSMLARLAGMRQHAGVGSCDVAGLAAAGLSELAAGHRDVALVLSDALAAAWRPAGRVRVVAPGQPFTGVWSALLDELTTDSGRPDLVVAADYDPGLRYLSLTGFATGPAAS
jgi:hypothetical protein